MWQYSSSGSVNGISGRVDMNIRYTDLPGQSTSPVINTDPYAGKTNEELAQMVINGELGNGEERKQKLGARYNDVQNAVNALLNPPKPARKSNEEIANEVLAGKWGNGADRKNRLANAGYDYNAIQAIINKSVTPAPVKTYRTYTVKKGDSLWTIAARQLGNGSRYKEIKTLNGLKSDMIYAGQVLKLPN
jgi:LysM repeat protein